MDGPAGAGEREREHNEIFSGGIAESVSTEKYETLDAAIAHIDNVYAISRLYRAFF